MTTVQWILDNCVVRDDNRMEGDAFGPDGKLRTQNAPEVRPPALTKHPDVQVVGIDETNSVTTTESK